MITALTPEDLDLIKALKEEGVSNCECAFKFDVQPETILRAEKEYKEKGKLAFSFKCMLDEISPLCEGKTLANCHYALVKAGLFDKDVNALRRAMKRYGVEYVRRQNNTYEINGIVGIPAIAKYYGLTETLIHNRLQAGQTIKQAVSMPKSKNYSYELNGMKGLQTIAKHYGIARSSIQRLVSSGIGLEHAVNYLVGLKNEKAQQEV